MKGLRNKKIISSNGIKQVYLFTKYEIFIDVNVLDIYFMLSLIL